MLENVGDPLLCRCIDGPVAGQIQPVEGVQIGQAQQRDEFGAEPVGRLVGDERRPRRRRQLVAEIELSVQRRVAQLDADHPRVGQIGETAVGQLPERGAVFKQIIGGPAPGEQQAQHLPIDLALARDLRFGRRRRGQHPVGDSQIGAVPEPQRVGHPDDFAIPGARGQRLGIEISRDDLLARWVGICAVPVSERRCAHHLAQLFDHAQSAAAR